MTEMVDIVVLIDRSGSMMGMETETIGAFNAFLREQQKVEGDARLTLVLFDNQYDVIYDGVDIQDVPELTDGHYFVRGSTSMFDAVGKTINSIAAKTENDKVVFLIQSDGGENTSQEYTGDKVKSLIEAKEEAGWDFNYIGTGVSAFEGSAIGGSLGLRGGKIAAVSKDIGGMAMYSSTMASVATNYRSGKVVDNLQDVADNS